MIKALKKIWDILLKVVLTLVIIMCVLFILPRIFKIKPYMVTSGSMIPKHPVGSLVYSKKVDFDDIKNGDSITFYLTDNKIVATHQVYKIDKENKYFYTRGINNKNEDGKIIPDVRPVKYSNVIGKVVLTIPYLGYLNRILTDVPGRYIVIFISILMIIISYLLDFICKKEKGKEKK